MPELPIGTVTFLFTDIEGSTRLWEHHPQAMRTALSRHDGLAGRVIAQHGGHLIKSRGEGDSLFAVFPRAADALAASIALQQAFCAESWPDDTPLRVRMAIHTGEADLREGDYYGPAVNRCARLRSAGHGGQILLSLATQERVQEHLPEGVTLRDLGERRLKDLIRPERVFQLLHPDLPQEFPPLNTLDLRPNNLPAQPTSLVGREQEVAAARDLLRRADVRLVTLTGPGGTGKTRLGLQVAADLVDEFDHGVFFVELAPITDPDLVVSTIAQTLGVREAAGTPLPQSLKEFLREKQHLLVLDNFEQVLEAAPWVAELLAAAPRLKVLVTSRAALRLRGEHEYTVPPLALPDLKHLPPAEALSQYAAVELFVQRAAAVRTDFAVTPENAEAVAEICHRLDGLPLAIELAAARVKMFPPQALLPRLENRLKLLTGGARDLPARQQTLRDTIAWSYDLLEESEQRLFRRLSAFVGGFTLEAAEAVCSAVGDLGVDVLDGVASLVDKSLLRQEELPEGEGRFRVLETIREYGRERLAESGEEAAQREQHGRFFLKWAAETAKDRFRGADAIRRLDQMEREHDNLRAALAWACEAQEAEVGVRLAGALTHFWRTRGYLSEGRQQYARLLALPECSGPTKERAQALYGVGVFATYLDDLGGARTSHEESLAIMRTLGDRADIATGLNSLALDIDLQQQGEDPSALFAEALLIARELGNKRLTATILCNFGGYHIKRGNYPEAESYIQESLTLSRELGDRQGMANALGGLGNVFRSQGDLSSARAAFEECLCLRREHGDRLAVGWVLHPMAQAAYHQGDYETAQVLYDELLAFGREIRISEQIARSLGGLARIACAQQRYDAARSLWRESLRLECEIGKKPMIARALEGLAAIEGAQGYWQRAARLLGAAESLFEAAKHARHPFERPEYERVVADVRSALGQEAFAAAWEEGWAMTPEEMAANVLTDLVEAEGVSQG